LFFAGYYYCIGVSGSSPTLTTTPPISTSTPIAPSPTQSGIVSNCDLYAQAASGDYCSKFAADNSITTTELYAWNAVLGPNGANCNTEFFAGYYYCVGISGSSSPTTTSSSAATSTTAVAVPSPTQSGIVSNCNGFAQAVSGDYCYEFASNHNITTTELYDWNTVLGSNGANCGTEFFAGYYYCISIS
jgi:LysM repeat protein